VAIPCTKNRDSYPDHHWLGCAHRCHPQSCHESQHEGDFWDHSCVSLFSLYQSWLTTSKIRRCRGCIHRQRQRQCYGSVKMIRVYFWFLPSALRDLDSLRPLISRKYSLEAAGTRERQQELVGGCSFSWESADCLLGKTARCSSVSGIEARHMKMRPCSRCCRGVERGLGPMWLCSLARGCLRFVVFQFI
jgi:hypothetical protein